MDLKKYGRARARRRGLLSKGINIKTAIMLMFVEAWLMLSEHKRITGALSFVQTRYVEPNSLVLGWLMSAFIAFGIVSAGGLWLILWYALGGKEGSVVFFLKAYINILRDSWLKIKERS